jgi:hypothetical protein
VNTLRDWISLIADLITIATLIVILLYGILNRDRSVFGRKVFSISVFLGKYYLILVVFLAFCVISYLLYKEMLLLLKGLVDGNTIFLHIISSIVAILPLIFFFMIAVSIATRSLYIVKRIIQKTNLIKFDMNKYQHRPFEIKSAIYGTKDHNIDVTQALREQTDNYKIDFLVNNSLAGDPDRWHIKTLTVEYRIDEEDKTIEVKERQWLHLPEVCDNTN